MASQQDTGQMTYFFNGEPVIGIYRSGTDAGAITYFTSGEPLRTIFPTKSLGQYFLMF